MKKTKELKSIALSSLKGNWLIAVLAGLVAGIFGASGTISYEFNINIPEINKLVDNKDFFVLAASFGLFILIAGIIIMVIGSVVGVGYARFNLNIVENKKLSFDTLFSYFPHLTNLVLTRVLQSVYIFLWSLLFIIPGIIKSFSYALTGYILSENPELSPKAVITASRNMMRGNKMRLFVLCLSFAGWFLLCIPTFGLGLLWLEPYINATMAAFYRETSGIQGVQEETFYYDI